MRANRSNALLLAALGAVLEFPLLCTARDARLSTLQEEAFALAQRPFTAAESESLPEFDPPAGGSKAGLDYHEYLALLTKLPFFDDGIWWAKQRPRGNVEKQPLTLWYRPAGAKDFRQQSYAESDFVYATPHIDPPLPSPIPAEAKFITSLDIGHREGNQKRWPQIFHIGGNGYSRLSGFQSEFSSSVRFGTHNAITDHETFPVLRKLYLRRINRSTLRMLGLIDSDAFTGALRLDLRPGPASRMDVSLRLYPRFAIGADATSGTGPLAISSMFWKGAADTPANSRDQAHDADAFERCTQGKRGARVPITIPERGSQPLTSDYGPLPCFGLIQQDRTAAHYADYAAASYAERANLRIDKIVSSVPYSVRFSRFFTDYEGHDNLVVYVALKHDLAPASTARGGIRFAYRLTASRD